ncbi:tetratricopeptide repeat protein [Candidatus Hydrogenedentota bacterium]
MNENGNVIAMASTLAAAGDRAGALVALERLAEDTNAPDVLLLKAKIYGQQGKYAEAILCCEAIIEKTPDHPEAVRCLEKLKRRQGLSPGWEKAQYTGRLTVLLCVLGTVALLLVVGGFVLGRNATEKEFETLSAQIHSLRKSEETAHSAMQTELTAVEKENEARLAGIIKNMENLETETLTAMAEELSGDIKQGVDELNTLFSEAVEKFEALNAALKTNATTELATLFSESQERMEASVDKAIKEQNTYLHEQLDVLRSESDYDDEWRNLRAWQEKITFQYGTVINLERAQAKLQLLSDQLNDAANAKKKHARLSDWKLDSVMEALVELQEAVDTMSSPQGDAETLSE